MSDSDKKYKYISVYIYIYICVYITCIMLSILYWGCNMASPGGSMSYVVRLPNNSYKPITNMAWVRTRLVNYKKGCTRLAATSDKVYQLLAHDRWFSLGTPASSTTNTGRHDIAEILLKVALKYHKSIKSNVIWRSR